MNRKIFLSCAAFGFARFLCAQEPETPPAAASNDLRAIRQSLQQQSHQIEALTQQVAKLSQLIEGTHGDNAAATAQPLVPEPNAAEPPKAEPVEPAGPTHVVAKGETLTSIAKHYKVTVESFLKMNKISDARKLQIGQTLIIPPTKNPASSPAQTENP